jgi:hypothetical protein
MKFKPKNSYKARFPLVVSKDPVFDSIVLEHNSDMCEDDSDSYTLNLKVARGK